MHRCVAKAFIPNPDNLPCVDHIDNNPLHNNVNNLRWCTQAHNCKNQKQKTEGKKHGVRFDRKRQRWEATGGKSGFLWYFDSYEDAKEARERWERGNEFYKKGNDENYSDMKVKPVTRRPKGTGRLQFRKDNRKCDANMLKMT